MPEKDAKSAHEKLREHGAKLEVGPSASTQNGFWSNPWELVAAALLVLIALVGVAALIAVLLSDGSDGRSGTEDVRILSPKDGDSVTAPVVLTVESPRLIADPAEGIAGAAHFHAWVDIQPFTPSGEVIPEGTGIYHFSSNNLTLDLPSGSHLIIVALGDNEDVRIPDTTVDAVTVTVE